MTGPELKQRIKAAGIRPEQLAVDTGYTLSAIHRWFSQNKPLPKRIMLALQQTGYADTDGRKQVSSQ